MNDRLPEALLADLYRVDGVVTIGFVNDQLDVEVDPEKQVSIARLQEIVRRHGQRFRVVLSDGADTMRSQCY